jgi:hypothetical protein
VPTAPAVRRTALSALASRVVSARERAWKAAVMEGRPWKIHRQLATVTLAPITGVGDRGEQHRDADHAHCRN